GGRLGIVDGRRERDGLARRRLDALVARIRLQGGAEAGEDRVRPLDPLRGEARQPLADTALDLRPHLPPGADPGALRARAADDVDGGSECRGILLAQTAGP